MKKMVFLVWTLCTVSFSLVSMGSEAVFSLDNWQNYMRKICNDEEGHFKNDVEEWIVSLNDAEYQSLMNGIEAESNRLAATITLPSKIYPEEESCPICTEEWKELSGHRMRITLQCGHQVCSFCEFKLTELKGGDYEVVDDNEEVHIFEIGAENKGKCPVCNTPCHKERLKLHQLESLKRLFTSLRKPLTSAPTMSVASKIVVCAAVALVGYVIWKRYASQKKEPAPKPTKLQGAA